jgi:hypothetical protein
MIHIAELLDLGRQSPAILRTPSRTPGEITDQNRLRHPEFHEVMVIEYKGRA